MHSMHVLAIRTIDKPNLHRLLELVRTTLPMIGHVSRIGELVFERTHQTLKRAIRQSNNKDIQIQSVLSSTYNDWQGRMSLAVPDAILGDEFGILACLRLLGGREHVSSIRANITLEERRKVLETIGPPCCVPTLLEIVKKSVISPRENFLSKISTVWTISGNKEKIDHGYRSAIDDRNVVYDLVRKVLHSEGRGAVQFADKVIGALPGGFTVLSVSLGNVVEVACYKKSRNICHWPFVLTRCSVGALDASYAEEHSFWAVKAIFETADLSKNSKIFAAVVPCRSLVGAHLEHEYSRLQQKYTLISGRMSLLEINTSVRKVAVLHDCDPGKCIFLSQKNFIDHQRACVVQPGSVFYLKSRENGYPPRQG